MRVTRLGWGGLFLTALTMMSAGTTGNNLLYLLFGAQVSAFLLSWLAGRYNLSSAAAAAEFPARIFRGTPFPLVLRLKNRGRLPVFLLRAGGALAGSLRPGEETALVLSQTLAHRGANLIDGIALESSFPFGLLRHRRLLGPFTGRAFPALREVRAAAEISSDVELAGQAVARKGGGDELYGIRERDPSDDARLINWKLSAKSGRTMVNEYCGTQSSKMTVRLRDTSEEHIAETASAVRFHIDAGAEVRLVTPEEELGWGRGLLHLDAALELLARLGAGKTPRTSPAPAPAPPPTVADTPGLRRLFFLGTLLITVSLFLIDEINSKLVTALIPVVLAGWALEEFDGPRLPKVLWEAVNLAVLVFIVFFDWRLSGVAIANTHLLTYLLTNRALTKLSPEELAPYFLILFLAFFLVSGLCISPWYFLSFLLYLAFAGAWLLLAQGLMASQARAWAPALGGLLLSVLAVSAAVFALTPRVDRLRRMNPFVAMGLDKLQVQSSAAIGFTEDVKLGFFGALKKSTARVARVRPEGPWPQKPAPLLVRGAAYDKFDGRRWSKDRLELRYREGGTDYATAQGRAWARRQAGRLVFPAAPGGAAFEFIFYPLNLSVLFTAGGLSSVAVPDGSAYFDYTDSAYFAAPYAGGLRYRLQGSAQAGFGSRIAGYPDILKARFLQLPAGEDPRIGELARRAAAGAVTGEEKARAVESYLRRTYSYAAYSDRAGRDLADFLFSVKKGNCEYFATSAAVFLRHLGIPSRLVTGFSADEYNEFGKFYDVRQGQAHAWAEAYAGGRWLTLDPTPPQGFFSSDLFTRRLGRYFDALQASWYRNVIGYDSYVQRNTFFRMGQAFSWEALWAVLRAILIGAASVALALAVYWWGRGLFDRQARGSGLFAKAQAALERAGLERRPQWTPREYAASVVETRPELRPVALLAELHYLQRYRAGGLSEAEERQADALLDELRGRL